MPLTTVTNCLLAAAALYLPQLPQEQVAVPALEAIQMVEGGTAGIANCHNSNGSCDLGPFQVNDRAWVKRLSDEIDADPIMVRSTLRDDPCWNTEVAAWILQRELNAANGDLARAIGDYHSHSPAEHMLYRQKVASALERLSRQSGGNVATIGAPLLRPAAGLRLAPAEPDSGFKTPDQAQPPPTPSADDQPTIDSQSRPSVRSPLADDHSVRSPLITRISGQSAGGETARRGGRSDASLAGATVVKINGGEAPPTKRVRSETLRRIREAAAGVGQGAEDR